MSRVRRLAVGALLLLSVVLTTVPAFAQVPVVIEQITTVLKGIDTSAKTGSELLKAVRASGVVVGTSEIETLRSALIAGGEDPAALALKSDPALRALALAASGETLTSADLAVLALSDCYGKGCALEAIDEAIRVAAEQNALAYYDEILATGGTVRPQYQQAYAYYMGLSNEAKAAFARQTRTDFEGDNALIPLPRILTSSEFDFVAKGVEQRARALQELAKDHFSGTRRYEEIIPPAVMEKILERTGETRYAELMGGIVGQNIRFLYGPDIIRDSRGVWRVIEDNHGYVGGRGDLVRAREVFEQRMPELAQTIPAQNNPAEFYDAIFERISKIEGVDGEIVVLARPPFPDNENARMHRILQDRGATLVTPSGTSKLVVEEEGVFLTEGASKKKVGYIIIDDETVFYTGGHPVVRHPWKRDGVPGLLDAVLAGKVQISQTPGADFLADKVLTTYVEDLIRLYLREEPILRDVPAIRFALAGPDGTLAVDEEALAHVLANKDKYVLKEVAGRAGYGVKIGPKLTQQQWESAVQGIRSNPSRYVAQEYTHLSIMGDQLVDLRFHSLVDENGILVSNTPWGRTVGVAGDGKVNISQNGAEATVLIVPDP